MHGWQSESTDEPKAGWSRGFWMVAVVTSTTTAGCSVVKLECSCSCSGSGSRSVAVM